MVSQSCVTNSVLLSGLTPVVNIPKARLVADTLDNLADGIFILTPQGYPQYANIAAQRINQQLIAAESHGGTFSSKIWHICQIFMETCDVGQQIGIGEAFPDKHDDQLHPLFSEFTLQTQPFPRLRIRIQWVSPEYFSEPLLLLILEDQYRTTQQAALNEASRCGLTPRETEVWLLRQQGYSYQQIAQTLIVSRNTIKQHLKRIYTKLEFNNGQATKK